MHAALHVYLEKGIRGAEMGEIARRAGIARGLVYYYFKDKMALYRALFTRLMDQAKTHAKATLATDEPVLTRLEKYALFYLKAGLEHPQMVRFVINMQNDLPLVFEQEGDEIIRDFNAECTSPLQDIFQEGIRDGSLMPVSLHVLYGIFKGGLNEVLLYMTSAALSAEEGNELARQTLEQLLAAIENKNKKE